MQTKLIEIEFEPETAFLIDINSQVPNSSAMSVGKFFDAQTQESWLGKCDCAISESITKRDACREKIANEIYGYYGISVPRLRISRQLISQTIKDLYALEINHGYYVMSRWLDRFDVYGYLPHFESGQVHHELKITVESQTRTLKERGLGHILAVAHWLNDIDVMNPSGKNVGYQLQLDAEGKLYVKSCKIDPGYAFSEFSKICNRILMLKSSEDFPKQLNRFILYLKQINGNISVRWQENHAVEKQITDQKRCEEILNFFQTTHSIEITKGDLFNKVALSCGYIISNIAISDEIQLSTQRSQYTFGKLPISTQQEYLSTLKKIIATPDEQIEAFFSHPNTKAALEDPEVKGMSDFVPIVTLIERLKSRRDGLSDLHEAALKTVQEIAPIVSPNSIPPILQRLYCQATLHYETEVKEKAIFYVPLDVTTSPQSDARVPMCDLWSTFFGIPNFGSLNLSTTTVTSVTPSTATASHVTTSTISASTITAIPTTATTGVQTQNIKTHPPVLLLLGASGGGKSLATQLLVEDLWKAFLKHPKNPIPLRLELKQFSERTVGQCIINTLLDEYRYNPAELRQLQNYHFVFILDGYDEIANQAKVNLLTKHQATEAHYGKWQAQFVISCRDSYFQGLDQGLFYPPQGIAGLEIRYLSALTPSHQIAYLMRYKARVETIDTQKKLPDYAGLLKENPALHELLGNPFLLRIFRDALPRWQQDHPNESLKNLTRYALYTAFIDQWFASEALRLSMIQAKYLPDNFPELFLDFSLRLAFTMHVEKIDEMNAKDIDQKTWYRFFSEQDETISEARLGSPLQRTGQSRYSFVHKSFLEYFVTRMLWQNLENDDLSIWNQRLLPQTPEILKFLVECYQENPQTPLKDRLWKWIQGSKITDQQTTTAANAITLLNYSGFPFIGEYGDLAGVKIQGADLDHALLDHTCFHQADLRNVNLRGAFLRGTNFTQADLRDVELGELPNLHFGEGLVGCLSYSCDGRWLAVGAGNNIELWHADCSLRAAVLIGHTSWINSLAFDSTGVLLASGSNDCSVRLWSTVEQKELTVLVGHTNEVHSVAFEVTGMILASGGEDKIIRLWSIVKQKELAVLAGHTHSVRSVAFNATGTLLASGSNDCSIRLWSIPEQKELVKLIGHTDYVRSVAFNATGTLLASGSNDRSIRLWSVVERKEIMIFQGHTSEVENVAFDVTGLFIASGGRYGDHSVRLWSVTEKKAIMILKGHTGLVSSVAFNTTGTVLASGSCDKSVRLWSIAKRKELAVLAGHRGLVSSVAFDATGTLLVSGSHDCSVRVWSVIERKELAVLIEKYMREIRSVALDRTGTLLASGSDDCSIRLWSVAERKELAVLVGHGNSITSVVFDAAGTLLASGSHDHSVRLWSVAERKELAVLEGHTHIINSVAFDTTGTLLASGGYDCCIRLWSVAERKELAVLEGHQSYVMSIAFDPTSTWIVAGNVDQNVRLWSVAERKELVVLKGHTHYVESVAFDATSMLIASGSYDQSVRLWSVTERKAISVLKGHTHGVRSVHFSAQGALVSAGEDHAIIVWHPVDKEKTNWQVIWRCMANPTVVAQNTYLADSQLSIQNRQVLRQNGALLEERPSYTNYRDSIWSKASVSTTRPPASINSTVSTTLHSFETTVLRIVKGLQAAIEISNEKLDNQAAATFTSTFLRAIRKSTLNALKVSSEDYGIPTRWVTWLSDAFAIDPILQPILQNPHPNSSRFELELWQEDLTSLFQRYAATTLNRQNTTQEMQTQPVALSSSRIQPNNT